MNYDSQSDRILKRLRNARTRWIIIIPASVIFGLLFMFSMAGCIGVQGDHMGCGIGSIFIGILIAIAGSLVAGIRLIFINRKIRNNERQLSIIHPQSPQVSSQNVIISTVNYTKERFISNIPIAVASTIVLSFVLLIAVNYINGYTTWLIFIGEIIISAAISFTVAYLVAKFSKH